MASISNQEVELRVNKPGLTRTADNLSSCGVRWTHCSWRFRHQRGQDPNASYADKAVYRAQEQEALWDKVTHMDAYDAGGLTFEIASLLFGQLAGKMARDQA